MARGKLKATTERLLDIQGGMSYEGLRRIAEDRLRYIRNLIGLYHTYEHNKEQLERYMGEMVQIEDFPGGYALIVHLHIAVYAGDLCPHGIQIEI